MDENTYTHTHLSGDFNQICLSVHTLRETNCSSTEGVWVSRDDKYCTLTHKDAEVATLSSL